MVSVTPVTDHRTRLLNGMAASVREKGFARTTLADVVRHAGVSRRTFYEHFTDPVDCYLQLIETLGDVLLAGVAQAMEGDEPLAVRIDRAVGSYLDMFAADPALSRSYWTEAHLTGDRGRDLTQRLSRRTGDVLRQLAEDEDMERLPADFGIFLAGGVRELALLAYDAGTPLTEVRDSATALVRRLLGVP